MNPESIMLSEISQSQRDKYYMTHLHEVSKIIKIIAAESRIVVARGGKNGQLLFNMYKIPIMQYEEVLENCCATLCLQLTTLDEALKFFNRIDFTSKVLTTKEIPETIYQGNYTLAKGN